MQPTKDMVKRLAFAVSPDGMTRNGKAIIPWVMAGEFWRGDTGDFEVTVKDFEVIKRNALERGLPLTIDQDHDMKGSPLGHAHPETCFVDYWQPSQFMEPAPTLFSEVTWFQKSDRPFVSPVIIFNARRLATSKLGKRSEPIGLMIERLSMVDSPFFPMPMVQQQSAAFDLVGSGAAVSGYLFETVPVQFKRTHAKTVRDNRAGIDFDAELYFELVAVTDERTDDICFQLDGLVLPAGDKFWNTHTPPLHPNCRCKLRLMTAAQAANWGKTVSATRPRVKAAKGFGKKKVAFTAEELTSGLMAAFNLGASPMKEELRKAIADIMADESKTPEDKSKAIEQLMASYETSTVERYTRSYVSMWNALASAFAVSPELADQPEAFAAAIVEKFSAVQAELTAAKADTDGRAKAFSALEAANLSAKDEAAILVKAAEDKAAAAQKALDDFTFNVNSQLKKHQAAGWDDKTAGVMFQHCRADYDKRMAEVKPVQFNLAPVISQKELPVSNEIAPITPMNRHQAQAYYYNSYIQQQTADGKRAFDQQMANEAIQFADSQLLTAGNLVMG